MPGRHIRQRVAHVCDADALDDCGNCIDTGTCHAICMGRTHDVYHVLCGRTIRDQRLFCFQHQSVYVSNPVSLHTEFISSNSSIDHKVYANGQMFLGQRTDSSPLWTEVTPTSVSLHGNNRQSRVLPKRPDRDDVKDENACYMCLEQHEVNGSKPLRIIHVDDIRSMTKESEAKRESYHWIHPDCLLLQRGTNEHPIECGECRQSILGLLYDIQFRCMLRNQVSRTENFIQTPDPSTILKLFSNDLPVRKQLVQMLEYQRHLALWLIATIPQYARHFNTMLVTRLDSVTMPFESNDVIGYSSTTNRGSSALIQHRETSTHVCFR